MEIHPIKTDDDLRVTLAEIEKLWDAPTGSSESDRLDVLSMLVHAYEASHVQVRELDAIEYLQAHMENTGKTQADLAEVLGSRPRASEVLNRRRPLTLDMIRAVCAAWNVSADNLVRQYELA
ncbi:MAG: putative transcription regulator with domain [Rhodospirillales bacterium]|jgi:HTH-type transcriptional regulator/antitoxin HigA|nr:putative transcription regulator with domain [Rhodospirillales bacterium]